MFCPLHRVTRRLKIFGGGRNHSDKRVEIQKALERSHQSGLGGGEVMLMYTVRWMESFCGSKGGGVGGDGGYFFWEGDGEGITDVGASMRFPTSWGGGRHCRANVF